MVKADIFYDELRLITSDKLRQDVVSFLNTKVPDYFYSVVASSSGKYHPSFAAGEGGLVRHTKMVVEVLKELSVVQKVPNDVFDCLIAACLIHDTFKHGNVDCGYTVFTHPVLAAEAWADFVGDGFDFDVNQIIYFCVLKHMGQWSPKVASITRTDSAIDSYCAMVHLADYIASRKFFDKYPNDGSFSGDILC